MASLQIKSHWVATSLLEIYMNKQRYSNLKKFGGGGVLGKP